MKRLYTVTVVGQYAYRTFALLVPEEVNEPALDLALRSNPDVFVFKERGLIENIIAFNGPEDPAEIADVVVRKGKS